MTAKYKEYLASAITNDGSIITYRALSRALKIHVNVAKELLYEFHRQQSSKDPASIHATYLLTGIRRASNTDAAAHGEDTRMAQDDYTQSSPFISSSIPTHEATDDNIFIKSVMLVHENELESAKSLYVGAVSIHIYSLEPSSIKNLQILEDSNRGILAKYANEDPLEMGPTYGTIKNPNAKRRSKRPFIPTPLPGAAPSARGRDSAVANESKRSTSGDNKIGPMRDAQNEPAPLKPVAAENGSIQSKGSAKKPVSLKKGQSDIFKSFAKSKPKLHKEDTESSAAASSLSALESMVQPMKDASEDEDDDFIATTTKTSSHKPGRKSIAERQAGLRRMMEDDDELMEDSHDVKPEDLQEIKEVSPTAPQEPEATGTPLAPSGGGRRRGRRKVMKKKTIKDEEGYIVTREEPVWESFSEAEPEPPKPKTPTSTASSTGPNKSRKSAGKPGQGNIMSFFGKK
ncbi:hypothetical protein FGG08_000213 [Glutinoglossum americanum]|uniref:DNA polymerase delta subunit 3 n=1 Tax=Glutinoglossum americanum TaxID=1670608 RepID=A0A9P8I9V2_9PEZI|nr:hypothetical protein FGG08_000213 [Glutinoglossum americanum]